MSETLKTGGLEMVVIKGPCRLVPKIFAEPS
jgi:hypothetical protein